MNKYLRTLLAAALSLGLAGPVQAQSGQISGHVRDATGAAVSGATISAMNQATPATGRATTRGDGSYTIPDLPPRSPAIAKYIKDEEPHPKVRRK